MADHWHETHRGVVFPWHCDHFGHFSARWYVPPFDDATFHLWAIAGCSQKLMAEKGTGTVTARYTIDYVEELTVGDIFVVRSAFVRLGNKSLTQRHEMHDAESGKLAATLEAVEVFFDSKARRAAPMPDWIRTLLEPQIATPPRPVDRPWHASCGRSGRSVRRRERRAPP